MCSCILHTHYLLSVIFLCLTLIPLYCTLHSHPLNHTLIKVSAAHTHTKNQHPQQSISHCPHSTPGYWTNGSNSTPTAIARTARCTALKDDLCAKRKKTGREREWQRDREKRPGRGRREKADVREREEWWNWRCWEIESAPGTTGPEWQEAPAEGTCESAPHCSHTAPLRCQHLWCAI